MKILRKIIDFFTPVDTTKSELLIQQYWREDRERKTAEARITKHSPAEYGDASEKIVKSLEEMSATDILLSSEGHSGPKIQFKIGDKEYITDEILDFTYENVMNEIKSQI